MPTIKDVAKEAGVSIATVSYVLSNDSRISDSTKEKVQQAIKKLGYVPNLVAQSLKNNKLNMIVIVIGSFAGPIYQALLDDMVRVFQNNGYVTIVTTGKESLDFIKANQVIGAIVLDSSIDEKTLESTAKNGAIVATRRRVYTKDGMFPINYIDGYKPSFEAIKLAIDSGLKKIMYIHGDKDTIDDRERFNGYLDALESNRLKPFSVLDGSFTEISGYNALKEYQKTHIDLPDLIYAANDEMAIGAIKYLNENGQAVPNKVKVLGYDDIELSRYVSPSLSTIHVNRDDWAVFVAKLISKILQEGSITLEDKDFKSVYNILRRESF